MVNFSFIRNYLYDNSIKNRLLLFLIFPICFFYMGLLLISEIPITYLNCIDPEYAYLFNGLSMAHLKMPSHIDHPGTPLQLLIAFLLRLVHLFRPGNSLDSDVFSNPELYIFYIRVALCLLNASALFLLGFIVYKKSGNFWLSFTLQLTPFISYSVIAILNRIVIEQMLMFSTLLLLLAVFAYLSEKNTKEKIFDRYLIIFALVMGFGTASKITFAPMIFIPLILLPGTIKKISLCIMSLISFGIFAFPIFDQWVKFRNWIANLFVHSGQYGGGDANFVNINSFKDNLKSIFLTDFIFPWIFLTAIIGTFLCTILFKKINKRFSRALFGISLSMIISIFMVAKQYKYHYLVHCILLSIPGLIIIILATISYLNIKKPKFILIPVFLILFFVSTQFEMKNVFIYHSGYIEKRDYLLNAHDSVVKNYGNQPVLVIPNNFNTSFQGHALLFGLVWCSGNTRALFVPELRSQYPNIYVYNDWYNKFMHWDENWDDNYTFSELLQKHKKIALVLSYPVSENLISEKFHGINRQIDTKYEKVFYNKVLQETIYTVEYIDSAKHIDHYNCNAEVVDTSKKYYINDHGQEFGNGITQSKDYSRSGIFSCKLDNSNNTGLNCVISEVMSGEKYNITVYKYNNNLSATLIASTSDTTYTCQSGEKIGNWLKLQIDIIVPKKSNGSNLKVYCINNEKDAPAYFDDLEIWKIRF